NVLTGARRPRDQRHLGHVVGHGDAHAAKRLDPLRKGVDQSALFIEVLVEEQVELIEGRSADLPVVLLVQIPQGPSSSGIETPSSVPPLPCDPYPSGRISTTWCSCHESLCLLRGARRRRRRSLRLPRSRRRQ